MASNPTRSEPASGGAVQAAARLAGTRRKDAPLDPASAAGSSEKHSGYGLPCSKCHLYYPADLEACPTCKSKERVAAIAPKLPARPPQPAPQSAPDNSMLEKEREEFLRQFKSQLMEAHAEVVHPPESVCKFKERHSGEPGTGEICAACYERLQERADVLEAALHIDLKEAAQIIYDAVWADPSDPSKTYQNAASALLAELRKRAGITAILGPFQPLAH